MERPKQKTQDAKKGIYESSYGRFETVEIDAIDPKDIQRGDRAFIVTESGNRYMLRRSKSNNDALMVYNEREGAFSPESGRILGVQKGKPHLAQKGRPFNAFSIDDIETMTGQEFRSTPVTQIIVIRGADTAVHSNSYQPSASSWGSSLAKFLGKAARGRKSDIEEGNR